LARTSRETVDADRPSWRAIARNDSPLTRPREISSRSITDNRQALRVGGRAAGRCNAMTARRIAKRDR
jgi:hypothetical protein